MLYIKDPIYGSITKTKSDFTTEFGEYAMINGTIVEEIVVPPKEETKQGEIPAENTSPVEVPQSPVVSDPAHPVNEIAVNPISIPTVQNSPPKPRVASDEELANVKGKGVPIFLIAARIAPIIRQSAIWIIKNCKFATGIRGGILARVQCYMGASTYVVDIHDNHHGKGMHSVFYWVPGKPNIHREFKNPY